MKIFNILCLMIILVVERRLEQDDGILKHVTKYCLSPYLTVGKVNGILKQVARYSLVLPEIKYDRLNCWSHTNTEELVKIVLRNC